MKKIVTISLAAAVAMTSLHASTHSELEERIAKLEKKLSSTNKKLNKVKAHDAADNIKWNVDLRTSVDSITYDMADGSERSNDSLMATRLWLNMAYAPDSKNIFKGQLSYNKAFGADFGNMRGWGMDTFDWVTNEALTGNTLKVRQAYWLYLGESAFGADIPWTLSVGRRPSTTGFLSHLREDNKAQSPLGHNIDVEFDGASSLFKLGNITGVSGMSFKICTGQGSTNAKPLFNMNGTSYDDDTNVIDDVKLVGFIFVPYDDGQYQIKTNVFRAFNLPGYSAVEMGKAMTTAGYTPVMSTRGDMDGAAISVMIDGLVEDTMFEETKIFGSFAWSNTKPDSSMLGSTDEESGTSYWVGLQQPLLDGKLGLEYNHGDKYWRSFTYAEDTMIGSKLAARGDAVEAYYTYQINDALSAQIRYTAIDYDYTGSNGFFGAAGTPMKISDVKKAASAFNAMTPAQIGALPAQQQQEMGMAAAMAPNIVEKAQDIRFYIRYRF